MIYPFISTHAASTSNATRKYILSSGIATLAQCLCTLALLLSPLTSHAIGEVRQPNQEYVESSVDLSVKTLAGQVTIRRTWSRGQWYINYAWADLKFTRDPLDNSIKGIDRGGSYFERTGSSSAVVATSADSTGVAVGTSYLFDRQYLLTRSTAGWRWSDRRGNTIDYSSAGKIQSYADRTGTRVNFLYVTGATGATLDRITDHANQTALSFSYTAGSLTQITDRAGRSVQYGYTGVTTANGSANRLTRVTDPTGAITRYEYNSDGQIITVTDAENRIWRISYASSLPAPTGADSAGIELKRAQVGATTQLPNAGPIYRTSSQSLTGANLGTSAINGDGSNGPTTDAINTVFGAAGGSGGGINPYATPIGSGVDAGTDYRKLGGYISAAPPVTTGASSRANTVSRVAMLTDPLGQITTFELDYDRVARQYISTVKYPATNALNATTTLPALPALPAQAGRIVHSLYDREGRMLQQATGAGAGRITATLNRISPYDEETLDERGLKTRTLYDAARNPLSMTYADGASSTASFEANYSLPTKRIDERGTISLYQYDSLGNLIKQVEAAGTPEARLTEYSYDSRDGHRGYRLTMTRRANAPSAAGTNASGRPSKVH